MKTQGPFFTKLGVSETDLAQTLTGLAEDGCFLEGVFPGVIKYRNVSIGRDPRTGRDMEKEKAIQMFTILYSKQEKDGK